MQPQSFLEEIPFSDADELIEVLRVSHKLWNDRGSPVWYFRGQSRADWDLRPKAYREDGLVILRPIMTRLLDLWGKGALTLQALEEAIQRPDGQFDEMPARPFWHKLRFDAECVAVTEFVRLAEELGIAVEPSEGWSCHEVRKTWGPTPALAIAQHHGIPTSLLDWTRRPLVAAHFAISPVEQVGDRIAIWAIRPDAICSSENAYRAGVVFQFKCPRYRSSFVQAQDGLFTWINESMLARYVESVGRTPCLLECVSTLSERGRCGVCVRKLTLPACETPRLRDLLWREGVSTAHLMPTLDNVANVLRQRWQEQRW